MRTQEEIVAKIKASDSMLGFELEVYSAYLTFEAAKPLLNQKALEEVESKAEWDKGVKEPNRDNLLADMGKYMAFAWEKVEDHRGISAGRSVEKMEAWLWLLEDEETLEAVKYAPYKNYGAPKLKVICDKYGFPVPDSDALRRMIDGDHCGADYTCGCGG